MNTRELIAKYGIRAQKKYGQNFLIDGGVIGRIIEGAGITKEDVVLEIGPGTGNMTTALAAAARRVIAVEIDESLREALSFVLTEHQNVEVIWGDVLKLDLESILRERAGSEKVKVVSNLPYYITTPIIMYLLESALPLESITVMVQKEVADRMAARPGTKDYGALTLAVSYRSEAETIARVPANSFIPRPSVDSTVVRLRLSGKPDIPVKDEALMFRLIRAAFNQRRKTLANAIKNAPGLNYSREQVESALEQCGFDINVRGETLSVAEFAKLSDQLSDGI